MKITKHGIFRSERYDYIIESFEFHCLNCNCHFIAERHECSDIPTDISGRTKRAFCFCPECGYTVKKEITAYETY